MGRYDNIKVYNGSSWVKPSEVSVWNGSSWVSLGADDSSNTNGMYVWNGSEWVRKTLNKTTTYGAKWVYGPISSSTTVRIFNNAYEGVAAQLWAGFEGWVYPTTGGCLFGDYPYSNLTFSSTASGSEARILDDGRIQYHTRYYNSDSGTLYTSYLYSTQTVTFNQWNYIQVKSYNVINNTPENSNRTMYVKIDTSGVSDSNISNYTQMVNSSGSASTAGNTYCGWDRYIQMGGSTTALKGTVSVWGADYNNCYKTSINIQNGTVGSTYSTTVTDESGSSITLTSPNAVNQDTGTAWT